MANTGLIELLRTEFIIGCWYRLIQRNLPLLNSISFFIVPIFPIFRSQASAYTYLLWKLSLARSCQFSFRLYPLVCFPLETRRQSRASVLTQSTETVSSLFKFSLSSGKTKRKREERQSPWTFFDVYLYLVR